MSSAGKTVPWDELFKLLNREVFSHTIPSVSQIAIEKKDPYTILISTIISLRTKDEVTASASKKLFARADTPLAVSALTIEEIRKLIYPAGFYKTKGETIQKISRILLDKYGGEVPNSRDELLKLPGVGLKTANLTLSLGFSIPVICVDTHVHRIANRMGWIETRNADESERELTKIMPVKYRIPINELLVKFGQKTCTPLSPWCSRCPVIDFCRQKEVQRQR